MKATSRKLPLILLLFLCLSACTNKEDNSNKEAAHQPATPDEEAEVSLIKLKQTNFSYELVSNGKVTAAKVAEVRFQAVEEIAKIMVKNGDHIAAGNIIAQLDTFKLSTKLEQAKDALERSRLDLQDIIIGQGFRLDKQDAVPAEVMKIARVKSGYNNAVTQYTLAGNDLKLATLKAPISGIVANLFSKPYSLADPSKPFCKIIGNETFDVNFRVLESELGLIAPANIVKIFPFAVADLEVKGAVSEINPTVDENGMVLVKAAVPHHPQLIDGMNVRVSIFRSVGKRWVVPKSAVVLRTNKQVVFTHQNGKAIWNYVQTGYENATQYTITSKTLKEGDQIIVSGNINLAHESPVKVMKSGSTN